MNIPQRYWRAKDFLENRGWEVFPRDLDPDEFPHDPSGRCTRTPSRFDSYCSRCGTSLMAAKRKVPRFPPDLKRAFDIASGKV